MSYDYLDDLFGKFRGHKTRYTELEEYAIDVIRQYYNREIDSKTFAETMQKVRESFIGLEKKDDEGRGIIDQDTPPDFVTQI